MSTQEESATKPEESPLNWKNQDNQYYYYNKPTIKKMLQGFAILGGLESGCDIEAVFNHIEKTQRLLEIGGGYGRVINHLLKRSYQGKIEVVENSDVFNTELSRFGKKITLYHTDILEFSANQPYDLILSMWSGISDFAKNEQIIFMKKLSSLLAPGGKLIMDTSLSSHKPLNAQYYGNQHYIITQEDCTVRGYIPTEKEMEVYATSCNLYQLENFTYETDQQRKRMLYVFQKK